jgi:hypothetical protein
MKTHEIGETSSADALCTLLVDNNLGDQTLHQIQALMESGDVSTKLPSALQLLLQSSEYQLA